MRFEIESFVCVFVAVGLSDHQQIVSRLALYFHQDPWNLWWSAFLEDR